MKNNYLVTQESMKSILQSFFEPKQFCYREFLKEYGEYIKPEFFDRIEEIDELYFFNKGQISFKPKRYVEKTFISDDLNSDVYRKVAEGLSEILKIRSSMHNAKLLLNLNEQELKASSYQDLMETRRSILLQHADLLIEHKNTIGGNINSTYDALLELDRVYPANISSKFTDCVIKEGKTYADFLYEYPKALAAVGHLEQSNNKNLKEVVIGLTDRILHMSASGYSLRKIQRVLTDECIESGIIPATVTGWNRERGANDEIISKATQLPMSVIKKVITDNSQLLLT